MAIHNATKLLPLTSQTKLSLTVTLTLTDTVSLTQTVRTLLTSTKRLIKIYKRNFLQMCVLAGFIRGQVSGLCLLDLTAAFDTVDHELLLRRLERTFRVRGQAIEWFKSYLKDRSYRVIYGGHTSSAILVTCSVTSF